MPEPATLSSDISFHLECNKDLVLLPINDEHHNAPSWSENVSTPMFSLAMSTTGHHSDIKLSSGMRQNNEEQKSEWKRGRGRLREGGRDEGWANCAQSPWQPLWHVVAIPAANIGALLNHLLCVFV